MSSLHGCRHGSIACEHWRANLPRYGRNAVKTTVHGSAASCMNWFQRLMGRHVPVILCDRHACSQRIHDYLGERALNARPRDNENPCAEPEPEPEPVLVAKAVRMKR